MTKLLATNGTKELEEGAAVRLQRISDYYHLRLKIEEGKPQ
jgi:hypothetical protein